MTISNQTSSAMSGISTYFSGMSSYLSNGGTMPDLGSLLSSLDYSELYNAAFLNQKGGSSYPNGTLIETVHHIVALQREYGMRTKSKADIYSDAQTDMDTESQYFDSLSSQYTYNVAGLSSDATPTT